MLVVNFDAMQLNRAVGVVLSELSDHVGGALTEAAEDVAAWAKSGQHPYIDRTGTLTRSIRHHPASGQLFANNLAAEVSADAPYAAAIEFGSKKHVITARNASALRFVIGSAVFYRHSVNHPGNKPYRFLAGALEDQMADIADTVLEGTLGAFRVAGFTVE